jgi:hypothetical protein
MTAAQKTAKANFKKAIEYRKKTGVSLKEAFAHVYGKKVGAAPKKKATKKAAPKKAAKKVVKKAAPKKAAKKVAKKVYGTKKRKPIKEQAILNKIHKVKDQVNQLDELQHKHMSISGVNNLQVLKDIEYTKNLIKEQTEDLERLQKAYKKSVSKINKELLMMDIRTIKNNFIPHNRKYLKSLQTLLKKSV